MPSSLVPKLRLGNALAREALASLYFFAMQLRFHVAMRLGFLCLMPILLVACAIPSPTSADQSPHHYRGVVLDADTKAPVGNAAVTACYEPFALTYLARDVPVDSTLSRKDGSFDLVVPSTSRKPTYISADVNLSATFRHPHKGQLGLYGGRLDSISEHHENVVLMQKTYAE